MIILSICLSPIGKPTAWSSMGTPVTGCGLRSRSRVPAGFPVQRLWIVGALAGVTLLLWGLVAQQRRPTPFGATLIVYDQAHEGDSDGQ